MGYETASNQEETDLAYENTAEVSQWRNVVFNKVDYAVQEGVMTGREAWPWYIAVQDTEVVEHLIGLSDYFDKYYDSGVRAIENVEDMVVPEVLLTAREKTRRLSEVREVDYQTKEDMPAQIKAELAVLQKRQEELDRERRQLDVKMSRELERLFYAADADEKAKVVERAKLEVVAYKTEQSEQQAHAEAKKIDDLEQEIALEIGQGDIKAAERKADLLGAHTNYGAAYRKWSNKIDAIKILKAQADARELAA